MATLWVQKWEESERGWGTRPDGYTLHVKREDIALYLRAMRAREQEGQSAGYVPDEYSRPCGEPYEAEIEDKALVAKVQASEHGTWGPGGNTYPKALRAGADKTGWRSMR